MYEYRLSKPVSMPREKGVMRRRARRAALFTACAAMVTDARATDYLIAAQAASAMNDGQTLSVRGHCRVSPATTDTLLFAICAGPDDCCCWHDRENNNGTCDSVNSNENQTCSNSSPCTAFCHRLDSHQSKTEGECRECVHQSLCSFGQDCCTDPDDDGKEVGAPACTMDLKRVKFELSSSSECFDSTDLTKNSVPVCDDNDSTVLDCDTGGSWGQEGNPLPVRWNTCLESEIGAVTLVIDFTNGDTIRAPLRGSVFKDPGIPALSTWGLIALSVLLLATGSVVLQRSGGRDASPAANPHGA